MFLQSGLKPGDQVSDQELFELIQASDARRAQEKALYLLEYRNYSKRELTEKIARTALPGGRPGGRRPHGGAGAHRRPAFWGGLCQRAVFPEGVRGPAGGPGAAAQGLDQELVQELVEKYGSPEQSEENIRRVLEKKYPGWREDEKVRRRAFAALQRLGYSYQEVREAMGQDEDWE